MATSFAAQVGAWAAKSEARLQATRNRAIVLLGEEMSRTKEEGGRVPFEKGNLARSLIASDQGMPKTAEGPFSGGNVGAVAVLLPLTKAIWLGYQAVYARRMNYGFVGADSLGRVYNQAGNHFVEGAIAQWPQLVAQAAKEVQSEATG
ncbi:hypothetical protein ACFWQD_06315 [Alcaligenes faecalis]|uniref:hypothetical protein n=1 Tax=Alcaligenes faecalis TaxID=511 RepID=UPI003665B3CE